MVRRPESASADASLVESLAAGDGEAVRRALAAGADPNAAPPGQPSPLWRAAGELELLSLLLGAGADPDARHPTDPRHPTLVMALAERVGEDTAPRIRALVKAGADLDLRDAEGETALFYAQRAARVDLVGTLLGLGANPNVKNRGGLSVLTTSLRALDDEHAGRFSMLAPETHRAIVELIRKFGSDESGLLDLALERAAREGRGDEVARLIAAGANPSFCPDISVLAIAAEAGDLEVARILVEAGADLDLAMYGPTPLDLAAQAGHLEVVRLLVEAGAAPVEGFPIALARAHGHLEVVAFLEASEGWTTGDRVEVRAETASGAASPTLFDAVSSGDLAEVERALVGADLGAEHDGQTVLERAFEARASDAIRLRLIAAGADLGRVKNQITWAARVAPPEVLTALAAAGADVDLPSRAGRPLQLVARRGDVAGLRALLDAGADVDAEGPTGNALSDAVAWGHEEAALVLLAAGASVEAAGRFQPLLALAAERGQSTLAAALLDRGAALDEDSHGPEPGPFARLFTESGLAPASLRDRSGRSSPLLLAVERGHLAVIGLLLERGADPRAPDASGQSALDRARVAGRREVLELLERGGRVHAKSRAPSELAGSGLEAVRARLSARLDDPGVRAVVARLETAAGSKARPLERLGRYELHVRVPRRLDVGALQALHLDAGCLVIASAMRGAARLPDRLVVFPTPDKFEAILAMGTPAAHPSLELDAVLERLHRLDVRHPFRLTELDADRLAGEFLAPPAEPRAVAEALVALCPSVLDDQGPHVDALAARLVRDPRFILAWA